VDLAHHAQVTRHVALDDAGELGACFFGYLAGEYHNELDCVFEGHQFGPAVAFAWHASFDQFDRRKNFYRYFSL
jgi:hypothetical protein